MTYKQYLKSIKNKNIPEWVKQWAKEVLETK
jgi:hypothetical protein